MKCCRNCEWTISEELEEAIMEEQGYLEEDETRPRAGDCCLEMEKDKNCCCREHTFIDVDSFYQEYQIMYDESYLGPGILIFSKKDGKIDSFIKISAYGMGGFPTILIRGFEKNKKDLFDDEFRTIEWKVREDEILYLPLKELAINLYHESLYSIDPREQGRNHLKVEAYRDNYYLIDYVKLTLVKDIYGVKEGTDFIDILLGDDMTCQNYSAISTFYQRLSNLDAPNATEEDIQKILIKR